MKELTRTECTGIFAIRDNFYLKIEEIGSGKFPGFVFCVSVGTLFFKRNFLQEVIYLTGSYINVNTL